MPVVTIKAHGPRNARTDPESGIRYYKWQGQEYPSVTSVRNLAGMPHPLANWRINQVINRAMTDYKELGRLLDSTDPKAVASWLRLAQTVERDAAADLGKRVHDAAAMGVPSSEAESDVAPFLIQYRDWMAHTGIQIEMVERQVWSTTFGYAGTFDLVGKFKKNGSVWLIDLKTGKGTYIEHAMQTEAYARADFVGNDDVVDDAATRLLKQVAPANRAVLHLRPEGWSFKTLPSTERTWNAFLGLLSFALWVDDNPTIDTLVGAVREGHA